MFSGSGEFQIYLIPLICEFLNFIKFGFVNMLFVNFKSMMDNWFMNCDLWFLKFCWGLYQKFKIDIALLGDFDLWNPYT